MRPAKIVSVKKIGVKPTMDITVESDQHVFYANNIVTSNSHSVSYAMLAYWSAYLKYYYPKLFFKHWLRNADEKMDTDFEVKQLIIAAKGESISVKGPHYSKPEDNFFWDRDDECIRFGLCNVKNFGRLHHEKFIKLLDDCKPTTWSEFAIKILPNINKRAVENLIKVGGFSGLRKTRSEMLHEFSCLASLTKKEQAYLVENCSPTLSVQEHLQLLISAGVKSQGGVIASANRLTKVVDVLKRMNNPGRDLKDNPAIYAKFEEKLLGYSVNGSEVSACADASYADTTCQEIIDGKTTSSTIAVVIRRIREHKTKNKDIMAFLTVEDDTGELENIVIFPDVYEQNTDILYEEGTVLLTGSIPNQERNSFIVETVFLI